MTQYNFIHALANRFFERSVEEYEAGVPEAERPTDRLSSSTGLSRTVALAGLILPIAFLVIGAATLFTSRIAIALFALLPLAAADAVLIRLGVTGRGAPGIVQPWRWSSYLAWLFMRLVILTILFLLAP